MGISNLEVESKLIPELKGHDFGGNMDNAIAEFEASVFGRKLPSYYDFSGKKGVAKKDLIGFERQS